MPAGAAAQILRTVDEIGPQLMLQQERQPPLGGTAHGHKAHENLYSLLRADHHDSSVDADRWNVEPYL